MRSLRLLVVALLLLPLVVVVGFLRVHVHVCFRFSLYVFFQHFSLLSLLLFSTLSTLVCFFNLCFVSLIRYRISQNLLCFPRFLLLLSLIKISHLIRFSIFLWLFILLLLHSFFLSTSYSFALHRSHTRKKQIKISRARVATGRAGAGAVPTAFCPPISADLSIRRSDDPAWWRGSPSAHTHTDTAGTHTHTHRLG